MGDLLTALALYPVTKHQICTLEDFHRTVEAAKIELTMVKAEPVMRLYNTRYLLFA